MKHYVAIKSKQNTEEPIQVAAEHYYAVDYVDRFYIGRVLSDEGNGFYQVKFLHQQVTDGVRHFRWPERDDLDKVHLSCIFWGPIYLNGCFDFTVDNIEEIEAAFRAKQVNIA